MGLSPTVSTIYWEYSSTEELFILIEYRTETVVRLHLLPQYKRAYKPWILKNYEKIVIVLNVYTVLMNTVIIVGFRGLLCHRKIIKGIIVTKNMNT